MVSPRADRRNFRPIDECRARCFTLGRRCAFGFFVSDLRAARCLMLGDAFGDVFGGFTLGALVFDRRRLVGSVAGGGTTAVASA